MHGHQHCGPMGWGGFWMGGRHHGRFGHHPPPPWFFEWFGGAARAEKGEVRYLILDALEAQPRHGYEVIQTIEQRSNGSYRPSAGTIYPTLQMLEEMGHVRSQRDGSRTVYEITDEGKADLEAHRDQVEEAYDRLGGHPDWVEELDLRELGRWARRMKRSVRSALRYGRVGAKEFKEITTVLEEAARKIEEILKR